MNRVLVASCDNLTGPDADAPCPGHLRYRWGQSDAACDTCGGRCGIAVASWVAVDCLDTADPWDVVNRRKPCVRCQKIANAEGITA